MIESIKYILSLALISLLYRALVSHSLIQDLQLEINRNVTVASRMK